VVPKQLIVVTRSSRLARTQTEEALQQLRALLPDTAFDVRPLNRPATATSSHAVDRCRRT
jgi:porphobilinogen deaminase